MSDAANTGWNEDPWFLNDPDESQEQTGEEDDFFIPVEWLIELPVVIDSEPPARTPAGRVGRKTWEKRLSHARARLGGWVRVVEPMTKQTASQIASDLRCSHQRDLRTIRVNGVLPGDRWDTVYGHDPMDSDESHFYVWMRWVPT
jgi:hypothetical protein